jgi:hypothetical protein
VDRLSVIRAGTSAPPLVLVPVPVPLAPSRSWSCVDRCGVAIRAFLSHTLCLRCEMCVAVGDFSTPFELLIHSTVEDDVRDNGHNRHPGKVEGPVAASVEHMNGSGWRVKMKTNGIGVVGTTYVILCPFYCTGRTDQ